MLQIGERNFEIIRAIFIHIYTMGIWQIQLFLSISKPFLQTRTNLHLCHLLKINYHI